MSRNDYYCGVDCMVKGCWKQWFFFLFIFWLKMVKLLIVVSCYEFEFVFDFWYGCGGGLFVGQDGYVVVGEVVVFY